MAFNFELWGGLAGIAGKAFFEHKAVETQVRAAESTKDFNNEQALLASAHQQGLITMNQIFADEAQITESLAIQKQEARLLANAEVSAAAAGVAGVSVDNQKTRIRRSAAQQQVARRQRNIAERAATVEQKFQASMGAIASQDRTVITQPSASTSLLGAAASGLSHVRQTAPDLITSLLTFGGKREEEQAAAPVLDRSTNL